MILPEPIQFEFDLALPQNLADHSDDFEDGVGLGGRDMISLSWSSIFAKNPKSCASIPNLDKRAL